MKEDIAKKWVAALRSGEYTQGKHYLCENGNYCCLGVLQGPVLGLPIRMNEASLSYEAMEKAELKFQAGNFKPGTGIRPLCLLNDNDDKSFTEIADIIEKHWQNLV